MNDTVTKSLIFLKKIELTFNMLKIYMTGWRQGVTVLQMFLLLFLVWLDGKEGCAVINVQVKNGSNFIP